MKFGNRGREWGEEEASDEVEAGTAEGFIHFYKNRLVELIKRMLDIYDLESEPGVHAGVGGPIESMEADWCAETVVNHGIGVLASWNEIKVEVVG